MQPLMLTVIALASTLSVLPRAPRPLTAGDWVGQIRVGDSSRFVRLRFESDTSGRVDLPVEGRWGIGLTTFRRTADTLSFVVPVPDDTLRFATMVDDAFLTGRVQSRLGSGIFRSIHRMPYDSALIRPLAGTYRIARDREIAMGPLDEAGGWLSFFDTRTRRAGVLYALDDSTLFTGPSFGVDFPIAIRATIARASSGGVTASS